MWTFLKLVKKLASHGKKPVKYAWDHKGTLLDLISHSWSLAALVKYVLDRI